MQDENYLHSLENLQEDYDAEQAADPQDIATILEATPDGDLAETARLLNEETARALGITDTFGVGEPGTDQSQEDTRQTFARTGLLGNALSIDEPAPVDAPELPARAAEIDRRNIIAAYRFLADLQRDPKLLDLGIIRKLGYLPRTSGETKPAQLEKVYKSVLGTWIATLQETYKVLA